MNKSISWSRTAKTLWKMLVGRRSFLFWVLGLFSGRVLRLSKPKHFTMKRKLSKLPYICCLFDPIKMSKSMIPDWFHKKRGRIVRNILGWRWWKVSKSRVQWWNGVCGQALDSNISHMTWMQWMQWKCAFFKHMTYTFACVLIWIAIWHMRGCNTSCKHTYRLRDRTTTQSTIPLLFHGMLRLCYWAVLFPTHAKNICQNGFIRSEMKNLVFPPHTLWCLLNTKSLKTPRN